MIKNDTLPKRLDDIGFYSLSNDRVKNVSETSQMKRCEMIIIEDCNFSCPYCCGLKDECFSGRQRRMLSLDEIKRNIDLWCQWGPLENIRFSGGEPTLHPNLLEAVAYAREKGIKRIAISTNGSNSHDLYYRLYNEGVNDFSISLDACCAEEGDKMAGGIPGSWEKVITNIKLLSCLTYVTVGIVLTPENVRSLSDTIFLAHNLGVSDIRVITSAQWNASIPIPYIPKWLLEAHPILKYRMENLKCHRPMRGIAESDNDRCPLTLDDTVIAGEYFYPCVIYMREQGRPLGKVGTDDMRHCQAMFSKYHDVQADPICKKNCLDVCIDYNNKHREYHG